MEATRSLQNDRLGAPFLRSPNFGHGGWRFVARDQNGVLMESGGGHNDQPTSKYTASLLAEATVELSRSSSAVGVYSMYSSC